MNKRQRWVVIATMLAIILYVLLFILYKPDKTDRVKPQQRFHTSDGLRIVDQKKIVFEKEEKTNRQRGFLPQREIHRLMLGQERPTAMLESYRSYSRYPHNSRPLTKDMLDLIHPWQVYHAPLPVLIDPALRQEASLQSFIQSEIAAGKSQQQIEKQIAEKVKDYPRYQFKANRHSLTFEDTLVVSLIVTNAQDNLLRYQVTEANIFGDYAYKDKQIGRADFNDSGVSPDENYDDGIYTFSWRLPSEDKKYWGNLKLKINLQLETVESEIELVFDFFASPKPPAFFTNTFTERIEDGNLVIDILLDVKKDCRYTVYGNLYALNPEEPTHWVSAQKILEPGNRWLSLIFFGKIFHDGGHQGVFRLQDLRGSCENLPFPASWLHDPQKIEKIAFAPAVDEPALLYLPYNNIEYTTQVYALSDFSEKEWQSPEKQERLRQLQQLVETAAPVSD